MSAITVPKRAVPPFNRRMDNDRSSKTARKIVELCVRTDCVSVVNRGCGILAQNGGAVLRLGFGHAAPCARETDVEYHLPLPNAGAVRAAPHCQIAVIPSLHTYMERVQMTHPKPDRSDYLPTTTKTPDNDVLDLGWNEGFFADGRPYRMECWAQDGITGLTFFFSTENFEQMSNEGFAALLEREGLVTFRPDTKKSAYAMPFTESAGNGMWSLNVVVGDEYNMYADANTPVLGYAQHGHGKV
jgi:hypothetical protein